MRRVTDKSHEFVKFYEKVPRTGEIITPRQDFKRRVVKVTNRSLETVQAWLSGKIKVPKQFHSAIAEEFGVDVSTIFPE